MAKLQTTVIVEFEASNNQEAVTAALAILNAVCGVDYPFISIDAKTAEVEASGEATIPKAKKSRKVG